MPSNHGLRSGLVSRPVLDRVKTQLGVEVEEKSLESDWKGIDSFVRGTVSRTMPCLDP